MPRWSRSTDILHVGGLRIAPVGGRGDGDVAVGDHADQAPAVTDGQRSDVQRPHHRGRLGHRRVRSHGLGMATHDIRQAGPRRPASASPGEPHRGAAGGERADDRGAVGRRRIPQHRVGPTGSPIEPESGGPAAARVGGTLAPSGTRRPGVVSERQGRRRQAGPPGRMAAAHEGGSTLSVALLPAPAPPDVSGRAEPARHRQPRETESGRSSAGRRPGGPARSMPATARLRQSPVRACDAARAVKVGALRAATGRSARQTTHGAFGMSCPSRRSAVFRLGRRRRADSVAEP